MDPEPLTDDVAVEGNNPVSASIGVTRLWLERVGIGIIAAFSIIVPLIIAMLFYLALTDGIVVNANDPLYETRLWMVNERSGATGIGLTITTPHASTTSDTCAATSVTFLKWDRRLRIESDASYCRCYEKINGQLSATSAVACKV